MKLNIQANCNCLHIPRYTGDYNTEIVDIFDGTAGSPCYNPCLSSKVKMETINAQRLLNDFLSVVWINSC